MKKSLKSLIFVLSFMFVLSSVFVAGCDKNSGPILSNCAIEHEEEFGGVYITKTIEEFNALGFSYGDSVNITFSNGYEMTDIPYYNGYYTKTGEPLLIAYPSYPYIKAAINNGDDLWDVGGLGNLNDDSLSSGRNLLWSDGNLDAETTATITLAEKGKYVDIQRARDIHYFDDRTLYPSDEVFANFRSLKGGILKENLLYRSASPCDNQHGRAKYVDKLIERAGVQFIIDLADNDSKIQGYMAGADFDATSPYFATLYDTDNTAGDRVEPLALNMNYGSAYFKEQVVKALIAIAEHDGPFLIHCTEGKDRTGFVCLLLEAFAGASYKEIVEDYMITYFNYYAITKAFDESKYNVIVSSVLNPMIEEIVGHVENFDNVDFADATEEYLLANGMTAVQITNLKNKILNTSEII